ncbi:glycosyltransferase family 2 protein [Clostridium sp. 'White wine YQ']|uniref:glycosyltransferase family 2 protein n=1 Tax=Clostridium sp. 'White wine YQ' TaxID=3027474 RepID=UPI00236534EC|nr:glycosyltransferase family 2 protein [Clostridium sp. 'White wine YQ']MDD7793634.1 glycosyltransferase family 2 protein [Clostridium sp. 'White wine YQ']
MYYIKGIFNFISVIFSNLVFIISLYFLFLSLFGLFKKKSKEHKPPKTSFALIVAAHNEEKVIKGIIESFKRLDYPKELFDIFVIADNCSDRTAAIAREAGAKVYERFDETKKGKGYALEWMFDKIFKMKKQYDSVGVFDADNLVSKNFLLEINNKFIDGYKVVQGYLDSKNPNDTWITANYSISFWLSNRMFQLARSNVGLSSQLGGTGFCIKTDTLKELGWGATCLTEDLEFSCKLVLNGHKVGWAHEAVVYDEKPLTLAQSWSQRKRWMQGFADVSSRYFFKLVKKGITELNIVALDCALYSIQPILLILLGIALALNLYNQFMMVPNMVIGIISFLNSANANIAKFVGSILLLLQILYSPFILAIEKKISFKIMLYFILNPIYSLTWVPISIQGIIAKNDKEWSHTEHTRNIDITELEKVN